MWDELEQFVLQTHFSLSVRVKIINSLGTCFGAFSSLFTRKLSVKWRTTSRGLDAQTTLTAPHLTDIRST